MVGVYLGLSGRGAASRATGRSERLVTYRIRPVTSSDLARCRCGDPKVLRGHVSALWVIDKHPEALRPDERQLWCPPEQASGALAEASVVIMTGSTLVKGGTDDLLEAARGARRVVMAGPTASPWPPTFFARGVDVLGGIRVTDGPKLLQIVSQGGWGYFFGQGAEKISIVRAGQ